ncbi:hypothetical protein, partial [Legionella geestiana]|uniref:hypothetical protein n=1 Tax=Legionella geestiana TaxID=45065 RepID=UPI001EE740CD
GAISNKLLYLNGFVGWAEHGEARHRASPKAGCLLRASCPALISAGYGAISNKLLYLMGFL